jgi:hypothetical protein
MPQFIIRVKYVGKKLLKQKSLSHGTFVPLSVSSNYLVLYFNYQDNELLMRLISLFNDHLSALAFRLAKPGR